MKYSQKVYGSYDKRIRFGCSKFHVLWREYLVSTVSGLTNKPNVSDLTQKDIFWLYLCQNYEKILWKCSLADSETVFETR